MYIIFKMQNLRLEVNEEYDKEFVLLIMGRILLILEIEKLYEIISKHNKLKIDSWVI